MSTYNGEKYLLDQLSSLLHQSGVAVNIIVRDDGSTDGTREILSKHAKSHSNIEVIFASNVGVVDSFLQLLDMVPPEADYVALCDQDDIWHEDKVERAIAALGRTELQCPLLYCSAVEVVDESLMHIRDEVLVTRATVLENALVQNIGPGCTMVLNRIALQLIQGRSVRISEIEMHDWWLYQVISATGVVVYDRVPTIKYRQHGGNVVGSESGLKQLSKRINRFFTQNRRATRRQASELLRVYGPEMCGRNARLVEEFLCYTITRNVFIRIGYSLSMPIYRQGSFDNFVLRLLIIMLRI
jgi:glycosyltransferase involved in cell wall biosynthesis